MPAPTNITAPLATDLGTTLPATVTQRVDDSGTTYTVWYKYTAQAGDSEIGVWAYGDASVYLPGTDVFLGPDTAPVLYLGYNAHATYPNAPIQVPVTPGTTYWFKIVTNAGNPSPANLTVKIERFTTALARGQLAVNDDTQGYPLVLLNPTTGVTEAIVQDFPAGEEGEILPDGSLMILGRRGDNTPAHNITIFDARYNVVATPNPSTGPAARLLTSDQSSLFYLVTTGTPRKLITIDKTGAQGVTTWTLGGDINTIQGMGVSRDNAVLYYNTGTAIKRWDLVNDVALSDHAAAVAGYTGPNTDHGSSVLVLGDGTTLSIYNKSSAPFNDRIIRRDVTGSVLTTYDISSSYNINDLCCAIDDPNSFWVWLFDHATATISTFQNIKVSDGSVISSCVAVQFEEGYYSKSPVTDLTSPARYGTSNSCPFWISRYAAPVVVTLAATDITVSQATLHGTTNPKGTHCNAFFRWGTDNPPTQHDTAPVDVGSGSSAVPMSAVITGLSPSTTYYFRAVGSPV